MLYGNLKTMRNLDHNERLQGYSLPEIRWAWEMSIGKRSRRFRLNKTKLKPGPAINLLILEFLAMPEAEQDALLHRGLTRMEALLAQDEAASDPLEPDTARQLPGQVEHAPEVVLPRKPGRPKGSRNKS